MDGQRGDGDPEGVRQQGLHLRRVQEGEGQLPVTLQKSWESGNKKVFVFWFLSLNIIFISIKINIENSKNIIFWKHTFTLILNKYNFNYNGEFIGIKNSFEYSKNKDIHKYR